MPAVNLATLAPLLQAVEEHARHCNGSTHVVTATAPEMTVQSGRRCDVCHEFRKMTEQP